MAHVSVSNPSNELKIKKFMPPQTQKHYAKQVLLASAASAAAYARYQARESEKPELQSLYAEQAAAINSPKRDNAVEKRIEGEIQAIKDRWAAEDADVAAQAADFMNAATPSALGILEPWIRLDLKAPVKTFGFAEDLPAGKTERDMVDAGRETNKTLQAERDAILKAPQTKDETAAQITAVVESVGAKSLTNVRSARYLDYNQDKARFEDRPFRLPKLALFDGVGKPLAVPDAMGLLCLLFPNEIVERLTALAIGGDDDSHAMNRGDRAAALADVDAKILENDRRGEHWIRVCQAKNIAGGPRWTSDPRAILDLV